jgi:hypothetical protein
MDFCVDIIIHGYTIEFVAENHKSFSRAEAISRKELKGRLV